MLRPIILNCRELEQLDVSSVAGITSDLIEEALLRLPNLKLLELSYCTGITACKVSMDLYKSQISDFDRPF